ncbi:hypothetical protein C7W88_06405 [Novosphingobium sp. THN1]|uniref:hypothetical protein n=1 Tax=Novosphingobium sp. THN1 TaxID=1016987 RepID=UPI000E47A5C8|nr:hypothetical protein [Novosphingobium sp. THN1]AXU18755.1 hypothetical protein C7W88_06405 [Novosphingobium sp. THN1]
MSKTRWLSKLFERRLFWVATGAFASAIAMLSAQVIDRLYLNEPEELVIRGANLSENLKTELIETVGTCLGRFDLDTGPHDYSVHVPTNRLGKKDYECLLRKGTRIGEFVKAEEAYQVVPGTIWVGSGWTIERPLPSP